VYEKKRLPRAGAKKEGKSRERTGLTSLEKGRAEKLLGEESERLKGRIRWQLIKGIRSNENQQLNQAGSEAYISGSTRATIKNLKEQYAKTKAPPRREQKR